MPRGWSWAPAACGLGCGGLPPISASTGYARDAARRWSTKCRRRRAAGQVRHLAERELKARAWMLALKALPERQRLALTLFHYEGMSQIEVGEVLGISDEAVESLLARARRSLKVSLKEEWRGLMPERRGMRTDAKKTGAEMTSMGNTMTTCRIRALARDLRQRPDALAGGGARQRGPAGRHATGGAPAAARGGGARPHPGARPPALPCQRGRTGRAHHRRGAALPAHGADRWGRERCA